MTVATATLRRGSHLRALEAMGEVLLGWGALSSLLYVGADVLAAWRYPGYDVASRTIGELSAIGAPTRALALALGLAYGVLVVGFGVGVWEAARGRRAVRATGALVMAYGALALVAGFFPVHGRGDPASLTDAVHVALAAVALAVALLQLAIGSRAAGTAFRVYSLATFAVVLGLGALEGWEGARIASGDAAPWAGAIERIGAGAYLAWIAILAVVLEEEETRAVAASVPADRAAAPRRGDPAGPA